MPLFSHIFTEHVSVLGNVNRQKQALIVKKLKLWRNLQFKSPILCERPLHTGRIFQTADWTGVFSQRSGISRREKKQLFVGSRLIFPNFTLQTNASSRHDGYEKMCITSPTTTTSATKKGKLIIRVSQHQVSFHKIATLKTICGNVRPISWASSAAVLSKMSCLHLVKLSSLKDTMCQSITNQLRLCLVRWGAIFAKEPSTVPPTS